MASARASATASSVAGAAGSGRSGSAGAAAVSRVSGLGLRRGTRGTGRAGRGEDARASVSVGSSASVASSVSCLLGGGLGRVLGDILWRSVGGRRDLRRCIGSDIGGLGRRRRGGGRHPGRPLGRGLEERALGGRVGRVRRPAAYPRPRLLAWGRGWSPRGPPRVSRPRGAALSLISGKGVSGAGVSGAGLLGRGRGRRARLLDGLGGGRAQRKCREFGLGDDLDVGNGHRLLWRTRKDTPEDEGDDEKRMGRAGDVPAPDHRLGYPSCPAKSGPPVSVTSPILANRRGSARPSPAPPGIRRYCRRRAGTPGRCRVRRRWRAGVGISSSARGTSVVWIAMSRAVGGDGDGQRLLLSPSAARSAAVFGKLHRHADRHQRGRDHEDDQQHQHHVDEGRDVDLGHRAGAPAAAPAASARPAGL